MQHRFLSFIFCKFFVINVSIRGITMHWFCVSFRLYNDNYNDLTRSFHSKFVKMLCKPVDLFFLLTQIINIIVAKRKIMKFSLMFYFILLLFLLLQIKSTTRNSGVF